MSEPNDEENHDDVDWDDFEDTGEDRLVFTLGSAAVPWILGSLALLCLAAGLFILTTPGWADHMEAPIDSPLWSLIPLPFAIFCAWRARRLLAQPYLELDSERLSAPSQDTDVPWLTLTGMEEEGEVLKLSKADGGEVHIDLRPIAPGRRDLVRRAIRGRLER